MRVSMLSLWWVWHWQKHGNKEWRMEARLLPWLLPYCHTQIVRVVHTYLPALSVSVVPTTPLKLLLQSRLVYKSNVQFLVIILLAFLWAFHIFPTHFFLEQTLSCFPCPVAVLYFCLLTSLNTSLSSWGFLHYSVFMWRFSGLSPWLFPQVISPVPEASDFPAKAP